MGPDQRFLGILDTSPFRIAIVYSIVFACGAAALLGAVDFAVSRVVDGSTDNLIEAEVQGLREQMLVLSRSDFIELIEQRSQDQDVRGAVYLMVDPQLRPVAGNVPATLQTVGPMPLQAVLIVLYVVGARRSATPGTTPRV